MSFLSPNALRDMKKGTAGKSQRESRANRRARRPRHNVSVLSRPRRARH